MRWRACARRASISPCSRRARRRGDRRSRARPSSDGMRHFIAVGGDGTGFEIVNGLFPEAFRGQAGAHARLLAARHRQLVPARLHHGGRRLLAQRADGAQATPLRRDLAQAPRRRPLLHQHPELRLRGRRLHRGQPALQALRRGRLRARRGGQAARPRMPSPSRSRSTAAPFDERPKTFISINNSRFTGGKMMMAPERRHERWPGRVISVGELEPHRPVAHLPQDLRRHARAAIPPCETRAGAQHRRSTLIGPMDAMIDGEVISVWPERLEVLHQALEVCV